MISKDFTEKLQEQVDFLKAQKETLCSGLDVIEASALSYEIDLAATDIAWRLDVLAHMIKDQLPQEIKAMQVRLEQLYDYKSLLEDILEDAVSETGLTGNYHDIKLTEKGLEIK